MPKKRITERAVLDAAEIKKFALQRAQQEVMAKLTPSIMKKLDSELRLMAEQQDPFAADATPPAPQPPAPDAGAAAPPPAPPPPSPDAGATAPVTPAPAPGATLTDPAVAAASTPIGAPAEQQVLGKIETNPESGGQELVIPIDSLFQQADASTGTVPPVPPADTPIDPSAVTPPAAAPGTPELSATPGDPGATDSAAAPLAERSSVILSAIDKLLENIVAPNVVPESSTSAEVPSVGESVLDVNSAVATANENGNKMYESFKKILTAAEEVSATGAVLSKKTVDSLRESLAGMKKDKLITERLWRMNTHKLDLLENGIRKASNSYRKEETQENMATATKPNKKPQSLKDFALKLFEGAEGFEKEVGKVDPAGDSEGLSDEHAKKASGNPKNVKAELEKAPFKHSAKEGDQGKALLEEIEKEINELMASMSDDHMMEQEEDADKRWDRPLPANQRPHPRDAEDLKRDEEFREKNRGKRAGPYMTFAEQEEDADSEEMLLDDEPSSDMSVEDPNAMTITIDLQGVSGDAVENVNVQVDGQPFGGADDVDDADDVDVDMVAGHADDEDEMMVVQEVRRLVREQMEALGLKTKKPAAKPRLAVNEVAEVTKQLDETRVLTARSLFLNKILVSEASLTEAQKRKIVEYLDKGSTVNEVKDIYGKIVKAINKNKAKTSKAGSLNESAANVNGKQIRQVSDLMSVPMFDADRWSKLAGIGKKH